MRIFADKKNGDPGSEAGMTMQKKEFVGNHRRILFVKRKNVIARSAEATTYAKLYKSVMSSLFLSYIQNWFT